MERGHELRIVREQSEQFAQVAFVQHENAAAEKRAAGQLERADMEPSGSRVRRWSYPDDEVEDHQSVFGAEATGHCRTASKVTSVDRKATMTLCRLSSE